MRRLLKDEAKVERIRSLLKRISVRRLGIALLALKWTERGVHLVLQPDLRGRIHGDLKADVSQR